ncbi:Bug family tripartite tricarboxylate transporter substrate binding protein [Reyranella sp.]|uniref:Bug family tripartite tricarboxylate transporter substrate binding protein n=1 Tax=Reyranella sp. TaxID=1929291 RepID=UPI003D0D8ACE
MPVSTQLLANILVGGLAFKQADNDKNGRKPMAEQRLSRRQALVVGSSAMLAGLPGAGSAGAQGAYPNKPVKIIVPFPAGGATDILARLIAKRLSDGLGQPFICESKPGAGGNIGAAFVAKSAPDGYSLLMGAPGIHAVNAHVYDNPGYDGIKDFAPVSLIVKAPNLLVINPSFPAKTLVEFIEYAKSNPGVNYGHTSNGGTKHLAGELLALKAGINLVAVAYKGGAPMMTDLLGGHLKVAFDDLSTSLQYINNNSLRALAITGKSRWPNVPDVPRVSELGGVFADYDVTAWYGLVAPAGTPAPIVGRLSGIIADALNEKSLRDDLFAKGVEPIGSTPEQFQDFIAEEYRRWGEVVRRAGIKIT